MFKNKQRGFIDFSGLFTYLLLCGVGAGVVIGFVLFVAVPWAWPYVKLWLHNITG